MMLRNILTAASALALAACAVGPDYKTPQSASAPAATGPFVSANSPAVSLDPVAAGWWRLYDDPVLDGLVADALANNTDVRVAVANIAKARAALRGARSDRLPQGEIGAGANYGRNPAGQRLPGADREDWTVDVGANISYEVDLFGRVSRSIEAARGDAAAAEANADAVRVIVAADTTQAYADASSGAARLDVARRIVDLLDQQVKLTERRKEVGMATGLAILAEIRERLGLPVLTDVHAEDQVAPAAEAVDVLQIPAFLCRQTDLLLAAGRTGRVVNVKKGQFLAPWDMANVAAKVASTGNQNILLTERGASFGYNTLVADMRALPIMAETGYPVVMDATHAVQAPGGQGSASGGDRRFAPVLARAAVAVGVAAVFIETHPDPDRAPSDGPNMIPLAEMPALIAQLMAFDRLAKG